MGARYLLPLLAAGASALRVPAPVADWTRSVARTERAYVVAQISEEDRLKMQRMQQDGVDPGGWDNDEYLMSTKTSPPPPSNDEALIQARAYLQMLKDKGMRPRPDVVKLVEDLEQGVDFAEVKGVNDGNIAEEYVNSVSRGGRGQSEEDLKARAYTALPTDARAAISPDGRGVPK
eukprot:77420-Prymnesium_polylepis.1